jgi:hypothetical protein
VQEKIPDFGPVYQHRVAIHGRRILAATPGKAGLTVHLYDIVTGKDVWSKNFDASSTVLRTMDEEITGVVDGKGHVAVLDAATGAELLTGNIARGKIGPEDLKNLHQPLLLADADRFYIALNKSGDAGKVIAGQVQNNFTNSLRCYPINGWVLALHRKDGTVKVNGESRPYKKGDLAWHSFAPLYHQMLILEMFDQLPVLIFSARYNEQAAANNFTWRAYTQSLSKKDGKFIYDEGPEGNNSNPQFYGFNVDPRMGTITLVGSGSAIQHYIDDGRKVPASGAGASLTPGVGPGLPGGANLEMPPPAAGGGIRVIGPPVRIQAAPALPLPVPPPPVAPPPKDKLK